MISLVHPAQFLELFVPGPPQAHQRRDVHPQPATTIIPSEDAVGRLKPPTTEAEMCREYIKSLKLAFPDIELTYLPTPGGPENTTASLPPCFRTDLPLMILSEDEDPFDDRSPDGAPHEGKRREVFDQILSQAELIFHRQHRTFLFMLIFVGPCVRILRFDRSSLFVTRRFEFADSDILVDFLARYAQLSQADRSYDTSVQLIDPFQRDPGSLAEMMRTCLQDAKARQEEDHIVDMWEAALDEKWPWWKLRVPDEMMGKDRWFVVGKPSFQAPGVRGRGTRCYIAVELLVRDGGELELDTKFVHLKDCWRVLGDGTDERMDIRKEGDTLAKLNAAKVVRVPTLVAHGDIKDQDTSASLNAWKTANDEHKCRLKTHQHYRLVVEEIGKPLSEFENSGELLVVLYDCILAHRDAMAVNVIHRDISGGNILLYKKKGDKTWHGLLTDWELSKDTEMFPEPRQHRRTGTLQFSAVRVLDDPSKPIVVADELECFFHVLIYYAVRFLKHNIPDERVALFLHDYFYASAGFTEKGEPTAPGLKRMSMNIGSIDLHSCGVRDDLRFMWVCDTPQVDVGLEEAGPAAPAGTPHPDYNHPLNEVIETLLSWLRALYAVEELDNSSYTPATSSESGSSQARRGGKAVVLGQRPRDTARATARTSAKTLSPEEEAELRALAKKLDDQSNVLELFEDVAVQLFPMDKGKDKLPEGGYVPPCSPDVPQLSELSSFRDCDAEDDDPVEDGGAAVPDAPAPNDLAHVPLAATAADRQRDEHRAAAVVPAACDDKLQYQGSDNSPGSPSPCPIRSKRAREDDAGCEDGTAQGTSGKRGRY